MHVNSDEGKIEIDITDDHDWVEQIGKTARYTNKMVVSRE